MNFHRNFCKYYDPSIAHKSPSKTNVLIHELLCNAEDGSADENKAVLQNNLIPVHQTTSNTNNELRYTELIAGEINLSRRIERLWNMCNMNPLQRIDFITHFCKPEYSHKLEDAVKILEKIAVLVWQRQNKILHSNHCELPDGYSLNITADLLFASSLTSFEDITHCICMQLEMLQKYDIQFYWDGKIYIIRE